MQVLTKLRHDKEIRNKLIITLIILFAIMIGYRIPLPGINLQYAKYVFGWLNSSGGIINYLTGSAFAKMSLFTLGITPYITASLILQFLKIIIKPLDKISKDGANGKVKMERITFICGAVIALIEALAMALKYGKSGLFYQYNVLTVVYATTVWTFGACLLMWIGQTISDKLLGNGISMIMVMNILSSLPGDFKNMYVSMSVGQSDWVKFWAVVGLAIMFFLMFAYVVVLQEAETKIKVTNSGKIGIRMKKADENMIPLKLNAGGVMPIILSTTFLSLLTIVLNFFNSSNNKVLSFMIDCATPTNWFVPGALQYSVGAIVFVIITFVLAYMYSLINFNTKEIANNLKQTGGIVDGLKPGEETAAHLKKMTDSMQWIGTTMLVIIALIPMILSGIFSIQGLSFGGTSIIILVNTIMELQASILSKSTYTSYKPLFNVK